MTKWNWVLVYFGLSRHCIKIRLAWREIIYYFCQTARYHDHLITCHGTRTQLGCYTYKGSTAIDDFIAKVLVCRFRQTVKIPTWLGIIYLTWHSTYSVIISQVTAHLFRQLLMLIYWNILTTSLLALVRHPSTSTGYR